MEQAVDVIATSIKEAQIKCTGGWKLYKNGPRFKFYGIDIDWVSEEEVLSFIPTLGVSKMEVFVFLFGSRMVCGWRGPTRSMSEYKIRTSRAARASSWCTPADLHSDRIGRRSANALWPSGSFWTDARSPPRPCPGMNSGQAGSVGCKPVRAFIHFDCFSTPAAKLALGHIHLIIPDPCLRFP